MKPYDDSTQKADQWAMGYHVGLIQGYSNSLSCELSKYGRKHNYTIPFIEGAIEGIREYKRQQVLHLLGANTNDYYRED